MRIAFSEKVVLLFCLQLLCLIQGSLGQLHIGTGTKWVSNTETAVVLNDLDLLYDADAILLNNIFRFNGTRVSNIGGNIAPKIYALSLAKTNPGKLNLNQSVYITKRINFETGLLDLNANSITLDPKALLTNENENSRVIGPAIGGYISIDADLSATPVTVNPGNLGALISTTSDLGIVNIARGHDLQHINDSSTSIARWYELSAPDNKIPNAGLRAYYFLAETGSLQADSLVFWQGYDATAWKNIGYTTRNTIQKYVEKTGLGTLHRFTLYPNNTSTSTPVTPPPTTIPGIVVLFGAWQINQVLLNWVVTNEVNNDHFTVERKYASDINYTAIASLPTKAPGGVSAGTTNYTYTDSTAKTNAGAVFYRIHQVGKGGESTYSNIITLTAPAEATFIKRIFPTIGTGSQVYIQAGNMALTIMQFQVYDWAGHLVKAGTLTYQSQWLPVGSLSHGVYRLVIGSGGQQFRATFIK